MSARIALRLAAVVIPAGLLLLWGISGAIRDASPAARAARLPVHHQVPPFSFTERSGRAVTREDLLGRVWVADFIFTTCANTCPTMTARMRSLQDALAGPCPEARLVSFSVDPERDTTEALSAYAERTGASGSWLFLRGPRDQVARLAREGFFLGGLPPDAAPPAGSEVDESTMPIPHSSKFALVDKRGRIRGYYDGLEPEVVAPLVRDIQALLSESVDPSGRDPLP